jgi:adhesin transport system outer membrane protein
MGLPSRRTGLATRGASPRRQIEPTLLPGSQDRRPLLDRTQVKQLTQSEGRTIKLDNDPINLRLYGGRLKHWWLGRVGIQGNVSLSIIARILTAAGASLAWLVAIGVAGATTLEDSVQASITTNPDVGVVQADRDAIEQELRQARAGYLPSIDLRGAAGPEYTNSPGTRERVTRPPGGDASTTLMRYESQITLSQMLFDGFATQSEVQRQLSRLDSAAYRVQQAAEFVGLDAAEAHLDVLRNQVLLELARENLAEHRRLGGKVRQLENQGASSIADVRQSEARIAAAETALATAQGNLRDAQARYLSAVGMAAENLQDPEVPVTAVPESQAAAAARATVANPNVEVANADIDAAKAELEGSRAGYYPRLNVEAGAAANQNLDGIRGSDVDAQALLVLRYNLFRGGADIAREREAFARVSEARQNLRQAQRDAEREARVAYNALVTARARVEALRATVEAQRATRDVYAQQFDLGQRSLLDLLDAENELFVARSDLATAQYTQTFGVYRVLAVTGDLLTTLNIDRPKQSIDIYRERKEPIHETVPASTNDHG